MNNQSFTEDDLITAINSADEKDDLATAVTRYYDCLEMIPDPIYKSVYATQIFISLGERYFLEAQYADALQHYSEAVKCIDGLGNPAIHLRLGQIRFELGDHDRAVDELMRAYMGGGKAIFEYEDPKYFAVIREIVK